MSVHYVEDKSRLCCNTRLYVGMSQERMRPLGELLMLSRGGGLVRRTQIPPLDGAAVGVQFVPASVEV